MRQWLGTIGAVVLLTAVSSGEAADARIAPGSIEVDRIISLSSDLQGIAARLLSRLSGRTDEELFTSPYGVSWAGEDLLVTDTGSGTVTRIRQEGGISRTARGALLQPIAAVSCFGGIVVSDSGSGGVALFDDTLRFDRWILRGLGRPTGMACLDETLAVVDTTNHRIVLVAKDGSRENFGSRGRGPGELNFPTTVARDGDELVVGDTLNFRIQRFDRAGNHIESFGQLGDSAGSMPRIKGIAIDDQRRIWVSDGLLDQIAVYSESGTFLMAVGARGSEPGAFSFPAGLAFSSRGKLAVADCYNRRVQVIRISGHSKGPR